LAQGNPWIFEVRLGVTEGEQRGKNVMTLREAEVAGVQSSKGFTLGEPRKDTDSLQEQTENGEEAADFSTAEGNSRPRGI
jgi:hypothetical protein